MVMNKAVKILFWVAIISCTLLASWYALHGAIHFHTDIARDFLLMEDIVVNHKPALIGPRSGGIPGVFHGPAWLYLNLPVFFLSGGNPAAVSWFWAALVILSIASVYFVTKKLSDDKAAMLASAIYGLAISGAAPNLFNPFGAVLFSPLYFYFLILYLEKRKIAHLLLSLFLIGLVIQFQMAWGVPVLILSLPLIFKRIIKHKKIAHLFSFSILSIPLSTYLLFDLRHQFLQTKSVINYLKGTNGDKATLPFISVVWLRIREMALTMFSYFSNSNLFVTLSFFVLFVALMILYFKKKKWNNAVIYFLYLYGGYFVLTLLFRGTLWGYYTWPFLPLFCIVLAIALSSVLKKYFAHLSIVIFLIVIIQNGIILSKQTNAYFASDTGLWNFYKVQAEDIFKDAPSEFGWFVYTADQYGYSSKYAMHYLQQKNIKKGFSYEKKPTTYLILQDGSNQYINSADWKKDRIKITRTPDKEFTYQNGSTIERYNLTKEEQEIQVDSSLIQDLMFR